MTADELKFSKQAVQNYNWQKDLKMPASRGRFMADGKTFSGDYLMKIGLSLPNNGDLTSAVIEISEVK